jgi:hypothetical protein
MLSAAKHVRNASDHEGSSHQQRYKLKRCQEEHRDECELLGVAHAASDLEPNSPAKRGKRDERCQYRDLCGPPGREKKRYGAGNEQARDRDAGRDCVLLNGCFLSPTPSRGFDTLLVHAVPVSSRSALIADQGAAHSL